VRRGLILGGRGPVGGYSRPRGRSDRWHGSKGWSTRGRKERDGESATANKAASKTVRESPPETYVDSMNGKRRPKYREKRKLAEGYYLHELTRSRRSSSSCSAGSRPEFRSS